MLYSCFPPSQFAHCLFVRIIVFVTLRWSETKPQHENVIHINPSNPSATLQEQPTNPIGGRNQRKGESSCIKIVESLFSFKWCHPHRLLHGYRRSRKRKPTRCRIQKSRTMAFFTFALSSKRLQCCKTYVGDSESVSSAHVCRKEFAAVD